jgi:hypothetical protein
MTVFLKGIGDDGFHEDQQPTALTMMRLIRRMRYDDLMALADAIDRARCDGRPKTERRLTANMVSDAARSFIDLELYRRREAAKAAPLSPQAAA